MSALLKFKPRYTGFETRQYVLAHEGKLRAVIARLLADLGERIAQEVEREMAAEKVSLAPLLKAEWNEADHPRDEDGKFINIGEVAAQHGDLQKPKRLGAIKNIQVWRVGDTEQQHIYFGSSEEDIKLYANLHEGHSPTQYSVSASNVLVAKDHFQLHSEFFSGKRMQDAVWAEDKKSGFKDSVSAWHKVQARLMNKVKAAGFDAVILTSPPAPAKHELIVVNKKSVKFAPIVKKVSLSTLTKAKKPAPLPAWLRRVLAKVNLDGFAVEVADAVESEERDAYKSAGMFAHTVLSTQGAPVSRFDVIDERSVEFASKRAAWLVGKRVLPDGGYIDNPNAEYRISDMIRENLRDIITRSTEEGWSAQQTAKEIRDAEAFSDKRAKNIARTELAFAHEQGALDEWRESGVVVGKRSILADTHPAPDVCDEAADEGVIPLDALFESSGVQAPPHHPSCLCAMVPEVEVPIGKADWDESKHPREPAGSEKGGEFIDAGGASLSDTKGQSVFSGKIKDRQDEDDSELELKLARVAKEKRRRLGFHASEVVYTIDAPLRRTEEGLDEIRHVMRAVDDFDIMDRVVNSQTRWGSGWAVATDEWEAAQRLGGNGNMGRVTKEELKQKGNPLSEKEVKGFEARREWMQQKFREKYGDEVEVYRGVKGAYAKKLTLAKDIDLPSYTLSSWSVNADDAMQFAGKAGHVLKTTIKAEDVWLLPSNGVQSPIKMTDEHDEIVVLNREKTRRVKLH